MKLRKKMLMLFLSFLLSFLGLTVYSENKVLAKTVSSETTATKLSAEETSAGKTGVVPKEYPTLPKGYEISQQFTFDTEGEGDGDNAYNGKSQKFASLKGPSNETRYSFFTGLPEDQQGIKYDGSGFSFWYKSEASCTILMEGFTWLYLDPAPDGRWVTYYYQGNIFYDNDVTQPVKYKGDISADMRKKIAEDPDKKYNLNLYRGTGDYYIDELFTFKAIKTDADKYENDEQAFKFSLDRYEYQRNTSADYIGSGADNGSVELYPTAGLDFKNTPVNITYNMTEADKAQFKKAVEIAKEDTGFLQIKCDDIICKKGEDDYFAQLCLTIMHIDKKTNSKTNKTEYVNKTLTKWIAGSGSSETFLINVKDIENFEELSQIKVQINTWGADADKIKFRLSPITVFHYPEDEIIVDTDWLKEHTTQNGEKLPEESALVYDESNDKNRQFVNIPDVAKSEAEIELPELPVGEYEVYANMRLDTKKTLYTVAVNNRIQDWDTYFKFYISNDNPLYSSHSQIKNFSLGKIKITKDYKDGPTKIKFKSFFGSGVDCINTKMLISYLSFKKTGTAVTAEPSDNFKIKDYPVPENYEIVRVLNDYNEFVRSGDIRYNRENQIYGYVGDKNAYNLNSRKSTGSMETAVNGIWSDSENPLDGSALRFWFKFDKDLVPDTSDSNRTRGWFTLYGSQNVSFNFEVKKQNDKYQYQITNGNREVIDSGDYDINNGAWATVQYDKIVENGDLSNINYIGMGSTKTVYIDELHTIQQRLGDISYEKNADGISASVTGYTFRIENADIAATYENVPVTTIKEGALSKSLSMKTVKLPASVTTIEKSAFAGDMNIKEINLDSGVTTIGEEAFKNCKKLGDINFSEKVTSIADNAFVGCEQLVMVVPYNSYAYEYAVKNNMNYRTTLNGYDFYKIGEEIHIADYVGTETDVTIPETLEKYPVTKILNGAFREKSMKTISSKTVTEIASEAFTECKNLENASFEALLKLDEKAFANCKALKNISLGNQITTIGNGAFEGDDALIRITLPETLNEIDKTAFTGCSDKLVADVVRDSYAYTFVNARDTAILQIPDTASEYKYSLWRYNATIIGYTGNDTELTLPDTIDDYPVVAVGEDAFKGNEKITNVVFSDKCKTVGDSAFYGCTKLSGFGINKVLQLGHHTFQNCPSLKEVTLTNVTKYWSDTFDSDINIATNSSQFNRTAVELTNAWHAGINIGCHFETGAYEAYGTFSEEAARNFGGDITREYIKLLSDSGFDVVRFPITWTAFVNDNNNYTIDEAYLDRIQEIVDWIIAEDMYVIINTHHDSSEYNMEYGWLNLANYSPEACAKYERIWEQVCERFKDYDEHLVFESLNEPRYGSEWDPKTAGSMANLNDLQERFVKVVRNSGGNNAQRYLMLETYAAGLKDGLCSDFANHWKDTFDQDGHMMVSVHFYNNNIGEGHFDYAVKLCEQYFTNNNMACVMGESATGIHSSISDIQNNVEKKDAWVIDSDLYDETGEIKWISKTVNARDYDDWYISTWLDKFLNVTDKYGVKLIYWEDSGSQALGAKGSNPWWYFPSAIDVFMNHEYNITVDGEKVTLKDLKFTLPENEEVSYYTNGKEKFEPGTEVKLSQVKNKTEIVSVTKENAESTWESDSENHWKADGSDKEKHTFDEWTVTKEATCTENGERSHSCLVCKKKVTEAIPATGHTEILIEGKEPTETEDGLTAGKKCSVCGVILEEQQVIPAVGKHEHEVQIVKGKEATCTEDGWTDGETCSICGLTIKEQEKIPKKGHVEEIIKGKEATCTEDGLTDGKKCSVCGEILEEQEVIPAKGHTEEIVQGKPATETEDGLSNGKKCSVCGEILEEQKVIPAVGKHEHEVQIVKGKEATCTEDGWTDGEICSICGLTIKEQEKIPKKGHVEEIIKGKEATCTEDGLTDGKKCLVCNVILEEQKVIPAKGHTEEIIKGKEATCTENGLTDGKKCLVCNVILEEQKVIPAKGHTEEIIKGKEATCTEDGLTDGKKCLVCNVILEEQKVIPAKGHTIEILEGKPATETENGLTEGERCSVCGILLKEQQVIPSMENTENSTGIGENQSNQANISSSDEDIVSQFNILRLRVAKTTKSSIKLKWEKVKGATGYIVYGTLCENGNKYEKLKTLEGATQVSSTLKKLKKGKYYKFYVVAVEEHEGETKVLTVSKEVYAAVGGGKAGNYKAVKLIKPTKKNISIKKGKKYKIQAKPVVQSKSLKVKKYRGLCYESTNPEIAQVDKKGKITAIGKGKCYIYAYNQTGNYVKIKVTVK